jgi:hypothetical protein
MYDATIFSIFDKLQLLSRIYGELVLKILVVWIGRVGQMLAVFSAIMTPTACRTPRWRGKTFDVGQLHLTLG